MVISLALTMIKFNIETPTDNFISSWYTTSGQAMSSGTKERSVSLAPSHDVGNSTKLPLIDYGIPTICSLVSFQRLGTFSCPKTVGFQNSRFQRRRSELLTLRHDLSAHVYKPENEPYLYPTLAMNQQLPLRSACRLHQIGQAPLQF